MTKATTTTGDALEHGPDWLLSRRARLKVYGDRLECGDWVIPYAEFESATLYNARSPILRVPCYVLRVETAHTVYHFGLNPGKYWRGELPFEAKRESVKLTLSTFSIILRVIALIWIVSIIVRLIAWWN